MSSIVNPAFSSAFLDEGTGPYAIIAGSSPTIPQLIILASGVSPSDAALLEDFITTAAAPSTTPDAFPAVTKLSGPNAVLNSANDSGVLPSRRDLHLHDQFLLL